MNETNISSEIEFPQIVVLGSQSTGKSSVLENIIGEEILPKGMGVITRRPIEIQLINSKNEWVEFKNDPGQRFSFVEACKHITFLIEKTCIFKAILNIPIRISIFSPKVINLLLIDLPGISNVILF